ncbi:MAG: T9SS type A sorting domain-containing protein [Fibrobacteria bacterium]
MGNLVGSGTIQGTGIQAVDPKPVLAEAFIAGTVLRVYLNGPASVSVYNTRGQQVFRSESRRALETIPLLGVNTGFIYLTVRTAQGETTKKLVFTGK